MKVYTKTGDKGTTSLVGGTRVAKNHKRIEAYGTMDELISYLALLSDQEIKHQHKETLNSILENLMLASSILASENHDIISKLPKLSDNCVVDLEKEVDTLENSLPELKAFIIPGGHQVVSICHICRTICRRAERRALDIFEEEEVPDLILRYLNRLSDFLFVLSRALCADFNVVENIWKPALE